MKKITQFRMPGACTWYDGEPDHHDGHGPYETRSVMLCEPTAAPVAGELSDEQAERAAYEAHQSHHGWAESDLSDKCSEGAPRAGEYRNTRLQDDWEIWQARAALAAAHKPVAPTDEQVSDAMESAFSATGEWPEDDAAIVRAWINFGVQQ